MDSPHGMSSIEELTPFGVRDIVSSMITKWLELIEAEPRGNARLAKITELTNFENTEAQWLKKLLINTYNPYITYGIVALPEEADLDNVKQFADDDREWYQVLDFLLECLASRQLTGNSARDAVFNFLSTCNARQKKWAERFILRDLRLNVGGKDLQKVFGKSAVPLFEVPLAKDYADLKKWDAKEEWFTEPKLDGGRCVAIVTKGNVQLLSRTGKPWGNFESVRQALVRVAGEFNIDNYVFDGEVVSLDGDNKVDFQNIQKTMHRKEGGEVGKLLFIVFDGCSLDEWNNPTQTYRQRFMDVQAKFPFNDSSAAGIVTYVQHGLVDGTKEAAESECARYVAMGYEGAILRKADAVVANKRSTDLLKVKTFKDDEAEIIGVVEGTGQFVGLLGALKCKTKDGVEFEVGSGFNNKDRYKYWYEKPIGLFVVYKFFELTNDKVPRFPIFKGIRHVDDMGAAQEE